VILTELTPLAQPRHQRLAVATIDLDDGDVTRTAFIGPASTERRFEIGSVTKGLTGMLVADSIERGEMTADTTVGEILDRYAGSELGTVTVRELCTHTSGLPRLGGGIPFLVLQAPYALVGLNPYRGNSVQRVVRHTAARPLSRRGQYRYSNLGAALVGEMVSTAADADYEAVLGERILEPIGMSATFVSRRRATAPWGHAWLGQPRAPWVLGAYAPAGGVVSTLGDMCRLVHALLEGSAPGSRSLDAVPGVKTESPSLETGLFWVIQARSRLGQHLVWHNGQTGGYSAFLGLFPASRRGVVALADTDRADETQHIALAVAGFTRPRPG
jgi:CubicO group peptidase (beta-lactamase class C family)